MKFLKNLVFICVVGLLLISCAQVREPSGGEIDTTPPVIVQEIPENFSTYFTADEFEIEFDEYVQLKEVNTNLIVSPPLNVPPVVELRGRKIKISWQDTLKENTTYTFNFGPSIIDVNEGNVYQELIYVFSTGDYIDSLEFAGNVTDIFTMTPAANTKVLLYDKNIDSLPLTTSPNYFGRTDANGNFKISYIKEGNYKIFALKEESTNYLYNGPPEKIAFSDSLITPQILDSNSVAYPMYLFEEKDTAQFIVESKTTDYGYFKVIFNSPADSLDLEIRDAESEVFKDYTLRINSRRDTLEAWLNEPFLGEDLEVVLSSGTTVLDTIIWYFETADRFREKPVFNVKNNISGRSIDKNSPINFSFNAPLISIDSSRISLMEDSIPVNPKFKVMGDANMKFSMDYDFLPEKVYELFIPDSVFVSIYKLSNDTIKSTFALQSNDFYGNLFINLNLPEFDGSFILQLINDKGNVIKEYFDIESGKTTIEFLKPAKYGLKLIFDENGNKEWDTGNYAKHVQPERIEVYKEIFQIRSNWDMEIDWNISSGANQSENDQNPSTPETSP